MTATEIEPALVGMLALAVASVSLLMALVPLCAALLPVNEGVAK